jgi:acetyl esterase/lipase
MKIATRMGKVIGAAVLLVSIAGCKVSNPKAIDLLNPRIDLLARPTNTDVQIGNLASQTVDIYTPPKGKHGGTLVWLHGGGWNGGTKDEISPVALWLLGHKGWTVISVNYRTTDIAPFPAALEDTKIAVRWAKANAAEYGLDPDRVFTMGWSAGGHLAALAATTSGTFEPTDIPADLTSVDSRPAGAVALSAPLDPMTFATSGTWNTAGNRTSTSLLLGCTDGESIDNCPVAGSDVAPATWADADDAPIYIASGDRDPIVDLTTQAKNPAAALVAAMGDAKVWLDVVDTGSIKARAHSIDFGMNRWALEQFLIWGPTF